MIKVNKAQFIAKLKKSLEKTAKVRAAKRTALENGLFVPTRNDIEEEFALVTNYKADATRSGEDETFSNLC